MPPLPPLPMDEEYDFEEDIKQTRKEVKALIEQIKTLEAKINELHSKGANLSKIDALEQRLARYEELLQTLTKKLEEPKKEEVEETITVI